MVGCDMVEILTIGASYPNIIYLGLDMGEPLQPIVFCGMQLHNGLLNCYDVYLLSC